MVKVPGFIKEFEAKHPNIYGFLQDIAFSLAVVAIIAAVLYMYAGMWPPMVSVNGVSMYPHMENGDLVFIQGLDRGDVRTYETSLNTSYQQYAEPGDVIVYKPYGDPLRPLVIHRAIKWVNQSEPMWQGGPPAPASGYITLGDNNHGVYDQMAPSICFEQPVQKDWILGIARFKIPYLGYLRSLI
jgi:signal peptidase